MKGTDNRSKTAQEDRAEKDVLEELFQHATPRQRPQADEEQVIRNAVHLQWREMVKRRRRKRMVVSLAAAASLALAVLAGNQLQHQAGPPALPVSLATAEKVNGSVFVHPTDTGPASRLEVSVTVLSGQQIVTGLESRVALRWHDGTSLRIDQNSEVLLEPTGIVKLVAGQLYVDTAAAQYSENPLIIMTPAGAVRHLGTQYMTRITRGETRVSVREGSIALEIDGVDIVARPGEQLIVEPSGARTRGLVDGYGELWEWTQPLAPGFELDGRSLADFLVFVGRESGRTIAFASPQAEMLAADTLLKGSVVLEPVRALQAVLQTTDLESQIRGGEIVVALRQ